MNSKRIVIFFWEGYLSVSPSLLNAIDLLTKAGYQVDVFLRQPDQVYAELPPLPVNTRILSCRPVSYRLLLRTEKGSVTNQGSDVPPRAHRLGVLGTVRHRLQSMVLSNLGLLLDAIQFGVLALKHSSPKPSALIGVDMMGLAVAGLVMRRVPLVYWSLELLFLHDMRSPLLKWFKFLERRFNRGALLTLIQDKDRAAALMRENQVSDERFLIVPNSPYGDALIPEDKHYFHRKFGLPEKTRIILQAGMIEPNVLALETAQAAARWSSSFALVLHDRMKRSPDEPYLKEISEMGGKRVFLSLDPVPLNELDHLLASAAIGLALYRSDRGLNFALMAGASGKLGFYLRSRIPVICINNPVFRPLIQQYRCGVLVDDVSDIERAAELIVSDYTQFSENALRCYHEALEFSVYFQPVIDKIGLLDRASNRHG